MNGNRALLEIDILDAQPETLLEPQAATIDKLGHELGHAFHLTEEPLDFSLREDDGDPPVVPRCHGFSEVAGIALKPMTEHKHQCVERLLLRCYGDIALDCQ